MSIVRTDIPMTSALAEETLEALGAAYPFLQTELLARTAFGRPVTAASMGRGESGKDRRNRRSFPRGRCRRSRKVRERGRVHRMRLAPPR